MTNETTKVQYRFERIEKKFWMSKAQYEALLPALDEHLTKDEHGLVTICNIYYDTPDYALIRRSIERPFFKEKLRVRSYGIPGENDPVFIEIKRKLDGIGYKRRIRVPFSQAKRLLRGEAIGSDNEQIEAEILDFVKRYRPKPQVYLTYTRYALFGKDDPDFRVTIDRKLMYRMTDTEHPSDTDMLPIMEDDSQVLMEIKACGAIPMWLTEELGRLKIYQAPFSKIGACYTGHIAPNTYYGKSMYKERKITC